jgi:hypothetical protein
MSQGSPAEVVSFERFVERRQRLAHAVQPPDSVEPPASTDPANAARLEKETRTLTTIAVAVRLPDRTTP